MDEAMTMRPNPFRARDPDRPILDLANRIPKPNLAKTITAADTAQMTSYTVYCAGAPHLATFSRLTGIPVYKLGVARFGAGRRIAGLCRHRYAGYWGRTGADISAMTPLEGADRWVAIRLRKPSLLGEADAGLLHFVDRGIRFEMPAAIHPETVDKLVDQLFGNLSLRTALSTDAGQHRLRNGGIDPQGWFWTYYMNNDRPDQIAEARELYVVDPDADVLMIATGLAALVRALRRETAG